WIRDHGCVPVTWTEDFGAMCELNELERSRIDQREASGDEVAERAPTPLVVPWGATILVPELAAEPARSRRMRALARFTANRTGVIGFDCVPLTSAETTAEGFSQVFATSLTAVRHFDVVATISEAAATEYRGWRRMLEAVGLTGPR